MGQGIEEGREEGAGAVASSGGGKLVSASVEDGSTVSWEGLGDRAVTGVTSGTSVGKGRGE